MFVGPQFGARIPRIPRVREGATASEALTCLHDELRRDELSGSKRACQFTKKAAHRLSLYGTTLSLNFIPKT